MTTPEIPEEATEQAASVLHGFEHDRLHSRCPGSDECELCYDADRRARALSAAALPHLRVQEAASKCFDCEHTHTADGCIGEPSPSDVWAGVTPSICDCPSLRVQETRGLREALEAQLGVLPLMTHENGYPTQALPKAELLSLLALHSAPHPRPVVDREALAVVIAQALVNHYPTRGMQVASGQTCECGYWTGDEPQALLGAGMGGSDQLNRHRAHLAADAILALLPTEEGGGIVSEPGFPDEPKPKWVDLFGIDPDFTGGRSIEEFLNPTGKRLIEEACQRGLAEAKDLAEAAGRFGYELGRKEAGEEIALAIEAQVGGGEWAGDYYRKTAGIARNLASQPSGATSTPLTAPTGHSDLPEGGEGL